MTDNMMPELTLEPTAAAEAVPQLTLEPTAPEVPEPEEKKIEPVEMDEKLLTDEEKKAAEEKVVENKELLDFIRDSIGDEKLKQVTLSSKLVSSACCLTSTGGFTLEMEKYFRNGPSEEMRKLRADRVLELNGKHAACLAIKKAYDDGDKDKAAALSKILYAQSELIAGVEIEDPTAYADLVCSLF